MTQSKIQILIQLTAFLLVAASGTGCAKQCRQARDTILEPTQAVAGYLQTQPSGQEFLNAGCSLILSQFEKLPEGAATIRRIADQRFSHSENRCIRWQHSDRMVCHANVHGHAGHGHGHRHCRWEPYSYCADYETDLIEEPGYREAVQLALDLDLTFARAHELCRQSEGGDLNGAEFASRDLLQFLKDKVRPSSDRIYAMACGSGAAPGESGWED
jgi:hypothetical protein